MLAGLATGGCLRTDVYAVTEPSVFDAGKPSPDTPSSPDAPSSPDVPSFPDAPWSPDILSLPDTPSSPDTFVCPTPSLAAGDTTMTLQLGTTKRSYLLHIPPNYDGTKPAPLILDFHGIGSSGANQRNDSLYPAVTDPDGVVMAFPDGTKTGTVGTAWNVGPCCVPEVDDVAFAKAVVTSVERIACIDRARVYAVGVLTGGGMVYKLACDAADLFAAVAPAAFDLLEQNVADCKPSRPITEISFRGNGESRVPYTGGDSALVPNMPVTFLGAVATFQKWADLNDCSGTPSQPDSHGCSTYPQCADDVEVILCTKQGGREDQGDATVAWPVLKRHTL